MSPTETSATDTSASVGTIDMKLEIVVIPVSDVDRAKRFYEDLGWRIDADIALGDEFRIVQVTPPGSGCSVAFGTGVTDAAPGSARTLELIVSDIEAARDALLARGVGRVELFHGSPWSRISGLDPERQSYRSYGAFDDPDGNEWILQEITTRLARPHRPGTADVQLRERPDRRPAARGHRLRRARREPGRVVRRVRRGGADRRSTALMSDRLAGQRVLVIGGSAGIGLETARLARDAGAEVIITARDEARLERAGSEVGASTAAFDATDFARVERFFAELGEPIDHVLVTGPGPYYAPLAEFDFGAAGRDVHSHLFLPIQIARSAVGRVRPGGTLLFMSGTGGRRTAVGLTLIASLTAAMPALTKNLALELAPIRVNLIAAGFVDTPLSATLLGDQLDERREQLRNTLPTRRVVGPADVAALAIHVMANTALTGATFDIDGGQQLVEQ